MNLYYKVELNTAPPDSCSKSAFLVTETMLGSTASQYHRMNWSKLKPHNLPPAISFKLNKLCFPHEAEICKSETRVSLHNDINICVHRSTGMWAAGWPPACVKCAAASPLESEGRFDNETFIGMVDVLKHNPDLRILPVDSP